MAHLIDVCLVPPCPRPRHSSHLIEARAARHTALPRLLLAVAMAMAAMLPEHASCEWWCVDTDVDGSGRVFINSTVTAIPDYAFRSCDSLVSIDLSGATALEAIGSRAFWDCDSLVSVNFTGATALEWIGERAFEDCDSLVSVNFTGATALESIGGYTFRSCDSLVSVDLSGATALESIGSFSFWGTPAATSGSICWWNEINPPDAAGRVAMSSDMVAIPVGAYASCSAVVSLDLSGATALRSIGDEAFMDCNSLVSVDLSGATALESIGGSAFRSCESLVSIDLSGATALRSIGASAFRASSLVSIDLSDATAFRTIGNYAFRDIQSLRTVKLPQGVANANFSGAFVGCGCPHNCPEGHFSCKGASMVDCATPQCYVDEITYAQDGRQQLFYWIAGPVLLVLVLCAYKGRLWDRDEIPYKIARPTRVPLKCCGGDDADGCTTCCWADPKEDASSCCWLSPTEPSNTADAEPGLVEDATNWDLHKLVWCGVFLRVADMLLDVAFNIINLGVVGVDNAVGVVDYCDYASDTCTATCVTNNGRGSTQEIVLNAYYGGHLISGGASAASRQCERLGGELNYFDESRDPNLFYIKYEQSGNGWPGGTADDVRTASTVFLGIGCVLTCFDVISAIVRAKADTSARCRDDPEQDAGAMSVLLDTPLYCGIRPWQFTLAISLLEVRSAGVPTSASPHGSLTRLLLLHRNPATKPVRSALCALCAVYLSIPIAGPSTNRNQCDLSDRRGHRERFRRRAHHHLFHLLDLWAGVQRAHRVV